MKYSTKALGKAESATNKALKAWKTAEKASNVTQKQIDDFKAIDPEMFDKMNTLTYNDLSGNEHSLDIHVSSDSLRTTYDAGMYTEFSGGQTFFGVSGEGFIFDKNHKNHQVTTIIRGGNSLAHELGHIKGLAANPTDYYNAAKSAGSCRDFNNWTNPAIQPAIEMEQRYDRLKKQRKIN